MNVELDKTAPVLLLGARGMLAREMQQALARSGWRRIETASRAECDIADADRVREVVTRVKPLLIMNCAAYTAVDRAELEPALAMAVNGLGVGYVARAAVAVGATLVHISTNAVFDGSLSRPYGEADAPSPLGAYGRSKHAGELEVQRSGARAYVIRTAHLYGDGGRNFFDSVIQQAKSGRSFPVVVDQLATPTWTRELSRQVTRLVESAPPGLYHAVADGCTSWYDAAIEALQEVELPTGLVEAVSTPRDGTAAPRLANGMLAHHALDRLGIYCMQPWRTALKEWLDERKRQPRQ